MTIFEDRERAAEYAFTRSQELGFLAERQGLSDMGHWAADKMALDEVSRERYKSVLIGRFIAGAGEAELLETVRGDLERGGKFVPLSELGKILDRAVADASASLHGQVLRPLASALTPERKRHEFDWTL